MTDKQSSTDVVNADDDKKLQNADTALRRDADFNTAPELNKNGDVILSQDIRDEQEREGYAPDIQPKAVPIGNVNVEGTGHSSPNGFGAMQPTGNLTVISAVAAAQDADSVVGQHIATEIAAAKDAAKEDDKK